MAHADHRPYADSKGAREEDERQDARAPKPAAKVGTYQDSTEKLARFEEYRASRNFNRPFSERLLHSINVMEARLGMPLSEK